METQPRDTGDEYIRRHVDADMDYNDIGYEAGRVVDQNGEIMSYSYRDMEVLGKFVNILSTKRNIEGHLENNEHQHLTNTEGKEVMKINPRLVGILSTMAFNMYLMYGQEEHMREAFDQVLHGDKVDRELTRQQEVRDLQAMWDTQ